MKPRLVPVMGLWLIASVFGACGPSSPESSTSSENQVERRAEHDDPRAPSRLFARQRALPSDSVPPNAYGAAAAQWAIMKAKAAPINASWTPLGPTPLEFTSGDLPNAGPGTGRGTTIVVHPTIPTTLYLGTSMGGMWRSDDAGLSWKPLGDQLSSMAVGAIAIDPHAPDTVYVGTGEGNLSGDSFFGRGVLKTTNGGTTWTTLGEDQFSGTSTSKIFLDAAGAIYVATVVGVAGESSPCNPPSFRTEHRGLFKSTDGGATWKQLIVGDSVADFEIDPTANPPRALVSIVGKGVVVLDEGDGSVKPVMDTRLQKQERVELARSKTTPNVVYAGLDTGSDGNSPSLYRSSDNGGTWAPVANAPDYCTGQCWYDNVVEVNPTDSEAVYLGGSLCSMWKIADAGTSPKPIAIAMPNHNCAPKAANWTDAFIHPDVHGIAFHPTNPKIMYVASDGGVAHTDDGGDHWDRLAGQLSTNQFYRLCVDPNDSTALAGGLQDNGTAQRSPVPGDTLWNYVEGGDGAACVMNLKDPIRAQQYMLVSVDQGYIERIETDGTRTDSFIPPDGERVNFVTMVERDPVMPTTVYTGTYRLWRSTQAGTKGTWQPISPDLTAGLAAPSCNGKLNDDLLTAIGVGGDSKHLYTGSGAGRIFASPDGGTTWTDVTHPPLPNRWITQIAVHPGQPNIVYASFSGFTLATPDSPGHVYRSIDGGMTWARFDIGLDPLDLPVDGIRLHPFNSNIVYAGTDLGVVATIDGGNSWTVLGATLPNVAAYDLLFHEKDSKLIVGTHGRGAWEMRLEPAIAASVPAVTASVVTGKAATIPNAFRVKNGESMGSVLEFTAGAGTTPWLTATAGGSQVAGLIDAPVALSISAVGLAPGSYEGTVVLSAPNALISSLTVPVHLTVTAM